MARMKPVKKPNLWLASSLRARACRKGIRACEIITALNLWSHGQLVTAESRLKVIRPYHSLVLSLLCCRVRPALQRDYNVPLS